MAEVLQVAQVTKVVQQAPPLYMVAHLAHQQPAVRAELIAEHRPGRQGREVMQLVEPTTQVVAAAAFMAAAQAVTAVEAVAHPGF